MTPEQAAALLDAELRPYPWYIATGVGEADDGAALFVYVKSGRHRKLNSIEKIWHGYKVNIEITGPIHPILIHTVSKNSRDASRPFTRQTTSGTG